MRLLASAVVATVLVLPGVLAGQVPAETKASSKVWLGRHAEFEAFLRDAVIDRIEAIKEGVTRPRRAYFQPGGPAGRAILKAIEPGYHEGWFDSYKSEIAAYQMDRLLGLDMVPPTVERRVESNRVSAQLWVEGCVRLKDKPDQSSPDVIAWNRQVYRQRVFDNLIANLDRNSGNILIDPLWNVILIDHSRAFDGRSGKVPFALTRIDREMFARLKALDKAVLAERVRPWLEFDAGFILNRRDQIVRTFEKLIKDKGEAAVLID